MLPGALSAYALPVHLQSVHLDPTTGEPLGVSTSGAKSVSSVSLGLDSQIPKLQATARKVQIALLETLVPLGYSLRALKAEVDKQVGRGLDVLMSCSDDGSS